MLNEEKLKNFLFKKYYKRLSNHRKLRSATFEISNACNFKCIHCYNQNLAIKFIPLDIAKRMIDEMCEMGLETITITGGEPTVHPNFKEIYKHCFDKGLKIALFSNGYFLDKYINFLKANPPERIEISIYGVDDVTYKSVCLVNDGFSVVNKNIHLLIDAGLTLSLKTVIMEQNWKQFEQINDYCTGFNVPFRFDLNLLASKDFSNGQQTNRLTDKDYLSIMNKIKKLKLKNWLSFLTRENMNNDNDCLYSCGAGRISIFINCLGGVRLCNFAEFSEKNIKDFSIKEIWDSFSQYLNLEKDKSGECYNCKYKKFCSNCAVSTYMEHRTNGKVILPVEQNCREAKFIYNSVKSAKDDK